MRLIVVCLILSLALSAVIQLFKQVKHKRLYNLKMYDQNQVMHCLDEHGGGAVIAPLCNGGDYQKWWIKYTGDGYAFFKATDQENI